MQIIETQKDLFNISAITGANWIIYFFKRLPLIGKVMPDRIYGDLSLKKTFAVIATVLMVLWKLLKKAGFIGLLIILPVMLIEKDPAARFPLFLYIYTLVNLIGPLTTSSVFTNDRKRYICVRQMHMNARTCFVSSSLFHHFSEGLYLLPMALIATVWMGGTLIGGILLTVLIVACGFIGEMLVLFFYTKTGVILSKKAAYIFGVGGLMLLAAYVPAFTHQPLVLGGILFQPLLIVSCVALALFSVYYIMHYNGYHELARENLKSSDFAVDMSQQIAVAKFADVAVKEKEFSAAELHSLQFEKLNGFAYLNAIFFARHRRLLVKPILIRLGVIAFLFTAGVIASFFIPDFSKTLVNPGDIIPAFVFIMYFASIGERVCRAMFYNCDISLLRYAFYRQKNAVLSNFKVRLLRIAGLNLIIAVAISAAVVGLALIFGLNWSVLDIASFALTILFLAIFFSVHHLFLYYVFQPYTTELGMKNPFYKVINLSVYLLCFFSMQIDSPPSYFTLIVLVSTFIYSVAALILVYKYAPQTFRVK